MNPFFQVHALDASTYAIRQNKCTNFEGPFLYLLLGDDTALLLDSGATPLDGRATPIRETIGALIGEDRPLLVAHTHSHLDHLQGDDSLRHRPNTSIVGSTVSEIVHAFGIDRWPSGQGSFDLGMRALTVLPTPGHEENHIAIYDSRTHTLFTGDVLYPGLIVIGDWPSFRQSAARLAAFAMNHEVEHALGAHVELRRDGTLYPIGTTFQPDEHVLQLGASHIAELHAVCEAIGDVPRIEVRPSFILEPRL